MVLADLGATVIRIDRPADSRGTPAPDSQLDLLNRGKASIAVDLKAYEGKEVVLDLVSATEVVIEGMRPGVTERLGVGPAECLARNPGLVFGRMTGWGQTGPLASEAGHDIDYIALSGALAAVGPKERPVPPLNLVGDFGGGGMLLAVGVLAAVIESRQSGQGQVVDAAMTEGSALLMASHHGFLSEGWWSAGREANLLDGGAPFYRVYETADRRHVAVGALEPQFFANLLTGLELDQSEVGSQHDRSNWTVMQERFAGIFATRTRDDWAEHFQGREACVAPVLSMEEAPRHPHNLSRNAFLDIDGVTQPAPAPRFSRTTTGIPDSPPRPGRDTVPVLEFLGYSEDRIGMLREIGAIALETTEDP